MIFKFYILFLIFGLAVLGICFFKKNDNLSTRVKTLLVLLHTACAIMIAPEIIALVLCGTVLLISLFEYQKATQSAYLLIPLGALIAVLAYIYLDSILASYHSLILILFSSFGFLLLILKNRFSINFRPIILLFFIPLGLAYFAFSLVEMPAYAITLILLVQFSDIFAFFGGKFFGKHKIFPNISPNKTREGFLFSILGVAVALIISKLYIGTITHSWLVVTIVLLPIFSLFTNAGDLIFSKIKRSESIKDFSNFLPGHGGFLDRIDNLIFCAPLVYVILPLSLNLF